MPLFGIEPMMVAGGALDAESGEIVWATSTTKCFLPGAAVAALKETIKVGQCRLPLSNPR
jgi:hypothetical protein